jgi:DNA-3-methyladenine glycosylase II
MRKALNHLSTTDPTLGGIIRQVGPYRITYREPGFDTLVRSIIYQQLSGKAAATIYGRLAAAMGPAGVRPEPILKLRPARAKSLGLSPQKRAYLRDLAEKTVEGALDFAALPGLSDQEVVERLTAVKGVGHWTAQMFLIFALRRPDVLPVGDLGIQAAIHRAYGLEKRPGPREVEEVGARWRPWASVAAWYLWRSLDGPAAL